MKRVLFVALLVLQAAILLVVVIQYVFIDEYGKTIPLVSVDPSGAYTYTVDISYLDFEINYLTVDVWEIDEELKYGEQVYVVLKPDDRGIYHAERVKQEKPELRSEEIAFAGNFLYHDSSRREYRIEYGIESMERRMDEIKLDPNKQWLITVKLAPWGQRKVAGIDELEN